MTLHRSIVGAVQARTPPQPVARQLLANRPTDVESFAPKDVFSLWRPGVQAAASGDNVITMLEPIGEDFWTGGGVTAKRVAAALRAIGPRPVEVHLNSPGGDMFEGLAIYNLLRDHGQPVTVKILSLAASAASIIAMAGDDVLIGAASFLMIHNCWVVAMGNRHDMLKVAETLAPFDAAMADVYAQRSGQSAEDCAGWMDAETYMNGNLAIERGFADRLLDADALVEDEAATARAAELNKIRGLERKLVAGGMTRAAARAYIMELKGLDPSLIRGTPGAAAISGTPGAAATAQWGPADTAAALRCIETLRRR